MQRKNMISIGLLILISLATGLAPGRGLAQPVINPQIAPGFPTQFLSPNATTVSISPSPSSVSECNLLDLYIDVNNVSNLYALDVRLSFDPAVVEVVDFNTASSVIDLEPIIDPLPNLNFQAGFTVRNEVNNFTGSIWYAATQTAPTPAANGSGHVARIRLRAKSTATAEFSFTYIKLSDPNGLEIAASGANSSVSASSSVTPSLSISRLNASQVQLSWPVSAGVSAYHLYRSTTPYFNPTSTAYQIIAAATPPATQVFTDNVLGNAATNYFYALRAQCTSPAGSLSGASAQVGKFEFELFETTGTDYTWVGLVLNVPGIGLAKDLANHIQNNTNALVSVKTIGRWNASAQNISPYNHVTAFNNFAVAVKNPYRVEIDLPSTSTGSVIWAQVGPLPAITSDNYTLYETSGTDYTWILQPLDMTALTDAKGLASDIQNKASAPVAVYTVSRWNGSGQNYTSYNNVSGFGNITTRFGYPYRVEVNVNNGFTVTWP